MANKVVGTPTNINMLSPLGFKFMINKLPNTNFFIQSINLPGVNLGEVDTQTPFTRLPFAGDHITFQDLTISFRVDEDLANYRELFDWMVALGFPESYDQSRQIYNTSNNITSAAGGIAGGVGGSGVLGEQFTMSPQMAQQMLQM